MLWKKEIDLNHVKSYDFMLVGLVLYFLIAMIIDKPQAFIGIGIFIAFIVMYKIYDRKMDCRLEIIDTPKAIKLFPGETSTLELQLRNASYFPMINGELKLQIGSSIKAYTLHQDNINYWEPFRIPLSLMRKKTLTLKYPVVAEQRGVAKVSEILYTFPHLLSFNRIGLRYLPAYQTEFIVFPKLLPVTGVEKIFHMVPGDEHTKNSPFEDIQDPLGTRDYHYSDPFHRINWKASVKSQGLQTNVYQKVVDISYLFVINLGDSSQTSMTTFNKELEKLMSYTAYMSEYATKNNLPFEIHINARKHGEIPYVRLPEGVGKTHYGKTLEMLARISKQTMTIPISQMLYILGKQVIKPKTLVFIGDIPKEALDVMHTWKQKQHSVFNVKQVEGAAVLRPVEREKIEHAI